MRRNLADLAAGQEAAGPAQEAIHAMAAIIDAALFAAHAGVEAAAALRFLRPRKAFLRIAGRARHSRRPCHGRK